MTVSLEFPDAIVEAIAQRAAEIVLEQSSTPVSDGFMNVEQAAEFTGLKASSIYKLTSLRRIPHKKVGAKLIFDRAEIKDWVERGGGRTG